MSITLKQVREGSTVLVRGDFGSGKQVKATVVEVDPNIKNGRPGICYEIAGDPDSGSWSGSWAYLTQIDEVVDF